MQYDYYALRQGELSDRLNALERADRKVKESRQRKDNAARSEAENEMKDASSRAVSIAPELAYLWYEACGSELANSIRDAWQKRQKQLTAATIPPGFQFTPGLSGIEDLPSLSFVLHMPFKLEKPYLSRDERVFHLLDSPVRKETVFQTPMVASTSWKGALRAAFWSLGYGEGHEITTRLFGNPRGSDVHEAGRLHFYPTFFGKTALEVINPHDRSTGVAARGPILLECVPQGTRGDLVLLYVPFGPFEQGDEDRCAQAAQDLELLGQGIQAMLTRYGFGAKTSSGFGRAEESLPEEGKLAIRAELGNQTVSLVSAREPEQPDSSLPRYLESPNRLVTDLRRPDGSLKSEGEYRAVIEGRGQQYGKKQNQLYAKARVWWEQKGKNLAQPSSREPQAKPEPGRVKAPPVSRYTFCMLSELRDLTKRLAEQLRDGDEV